MGVPGLQDDVVRAELGDHRLHVLEGRLLVMPVVAHLWRQVGDGLHLGGAYQDNRIIPYEGVTGEMLTPRQRQNLLDLSREYLGTLPTGPLEARMNDIERHLEATHFCWIGGRKEGEPFYYRIQSPVVLIEFDHHAGVYLTNTEPANFHVHTLVRTPNGNDYGIDLIRQHYEEAGHHRLDGDR